MSTEILDKEDIVNNSEFLKSLVTKIRAYDSYGAWAKFSDLYLLKPFIKTKEEKKKIDAHDDVDSKTLGLIRVFYEAIAYVIEQKTNIFTTTAIDISHEGFGRALIYSGNIIILEKTLRDVQKFGFGSFEKMDEEGKRSVEKAIKNVEKFKEFLS